MRTVINIVAIPILVLTAAVVVVLVVAVVKMNTVICTSHCSTGLATSSATAVARQPMHTTTIATSE